MFKKLWNEIQGVCVTTKIKFWCAELRLYSRILMKDELSFSILFKRACLYYAMIRQHINDVKTAQPELKVPEKLRSTSRKAYNTMEYIKGLAVKKGIDIGDWRNMFFMAKQEVKDLAI